MTYSADETRALLQEAIDKSEQAEGQLNGAIYQGITDVSAVLARLKEAIDRQTRQQLALQSTVTTARNAANGALVGSNTGEASAFLQKVLEENEDNVAKLWAIKDKLDTQLQDIIHSYSSVNEENAARLRSAVGYLNQHMNAT
jgi:polyhydroxyalkanoate synthesis regulator phasin